MFLKLKNHKQIVTVVIASFIGELDIRVRYQGYKSRRSFGPAGFIFFG